jgi:hypothetical protein
MGRLVPNEECDGEVGLARRQGTAETAHRGASEEFSDEGVEAGHRPAEGLQLIYLGSLEVDPQTSRVANGESAEGVVRPNDPLKDILEHETEFERYLGQQEGCEAVVQDLTGPAGVEASESRDHVGDRRYGVQEVAVGLIAPTRRGSIVGKLPL